MHGQQNIKFNRRNQTNRTNTFLSKPNKCLELESMHKMCPSRHFWTRRKFESFVRMISKARYNANGTLTLYARVAKYKFYLKLSTAWRERGKRKKVNDSRAPARSLTFRMETSLERHHPWSWHLLWLLKSSLRLYLGQYCLSRGPYLKIGHYNHAGNCCCLLWHSGHENVWKIVWEMCCLRNTVCCFM